MVKVEETTYDEGGDDGNSLVTKRTQPVEDSATDKRETSFSRLQVSITAGLPGGATDQVTTYTFGTTKGASAGDSKIATGHQLRRPQRRTLSPP